MSIAIKQLSFHPYLLKSQDNNMFILSKFNISGWNEDLFSPKSYLGQLKQNKSHTTICTTHPQYAPCELSNVMKTVLSSTLCYKLLLSTVT